MNAPEPFEVPIDGVLDLHAFNPRDVQAVVDAYLDAALERGLSEVRLVHGRGQGVQRAAVRAVLARHPAVHDCWDAPDSHLGATIAALEPRRPSF